MLYNSSLQIHQIQLIDTQNQLELIAIIVIIRKNEPTYHRKTFNCKLREIGVRYQAKKANNWQIIGNIYQYLYLYMQYLPANTIQHATYAIFLCFKIN